MRKSVLLVFSGSLAIALLLTAMWIYCDRSVSVIEEQAGTISYDRHFVMVSGEQSALWEQVYRGAQEAGTREGVRLEWNAAETISGYTIRDNMNVAIAEQADGIILCSSPGDDLTDEIRDAEQEGIPVVTVLNDVEDSGRVGYVGLNSYQVGEAYGEQIFQAMHPGVNRVVVLTADEPGGNEDLVINHMTETVERGKNSGKIAAFSEIGVDTSESFAAEETVRNIFLSGDELPDVLVCLDAVTTECALQEAIDYNEVGNVAIIGYFVSDSVQDALKKGIIQASVSLDAETMGSKAVETLSEYLLLGHASDFTTVDFEMKTAAKTGGAEEVG